MRERRLGFRVPMPVWLTSYIRDRPLRGLATDLSDGGVGLAAVAVRPPAPGQVVAVELELPDAGERIWAAATVTCAQTDGTAGGLTTHLGLRFTAMAQSEARRLRDVCLEARHRHLGALLARVRPHLA